MHIVVTDSGVGGLSVVAYAERFVRMQGFDEPVRLTFANAAPANDYGYNAMPSRAAKLETFDCFLRNAAARFAPDMIYVACNTLSVLLPDTPYVAQAEIRRWVGEAVAKMPRRDAPVVACLACTHYGYRKDFFAAALGPGAVVIDPNESAVGDLFPRGGASHDVDVELVTRYALPPATVETLTWLLREISPRTVAAMQHFVHVPDLF